MISFAVTKQKEQFEIMPFICYRDLGTPRLLHFMINLKTCQVAVPQEKLSCNATNTFCQVLDKEDWDHFNLGTVIIPS